VPSIKYIEFDGTVHEVEVKSGYSLMVAAVQNGIPGIDGECGGKCSCGTCHIYVAPNWQSLTGEPNNMEKKMLELIPSASETSRLACQIEIRNDLEGLEVRMPEYQF
jgi:ferredoxin, 2Fe-2S